MSICMRGCRRQGGKSEPPHAHTTRGQTQAHSEGAFARDNHCEARREARRLRRKRVFNTRRPPSREGHVAL
eukprot:7284488-Alexandrium_andersonii.AAC.1